MAEEVKLKSQHVYLNLDGCYNDVLQQTMQYSLSKTLGM